MKVEDIEKIGVIGAGTMGPGIAQSFAQSGFHVSITDEDEEVLRSAVGRIREGLELFVEKKVLDEGEVEPVLERIETVSSLEYAVAGADFVIEVVPEVLEIKQSVFEKLDEFCSEECILASNTSGTMSIDEISSTTDRMEKSIVTHWINPPQIMRLVEIVPGEKTSEEVIETTKKLLKNIGKTPVVCKKFEPGFINNTLQSALMMKAYELLQKGVANMEDIDTVVKEGFGSRLATVGPFEFVDMAGLDNLLNNLKSMYERTGDEDDKPPELLKQKVESGELGWKTEKGIYEYDKDYETLEKEAYSSLIEQFKALNRLEKDD